MDSIKQLEYLTAITIRDSYRDIIEIKRNDPCPCGSGLKFKNCHKDSGVELPPLSLRLEVKVGVVQSVVYDANLYESN
ncbi:SEC-C metal-binding domain-containing protein [Bacillus paramycoides]|uniref:SEC-C metal-binding domain-containing protein n=1 Tax=Bacillus paramycoides TaxID=2026194 RepID=UPI003D020201